jgi:hypothetical protein
MIDTIFAENRMPDNKERLLFTEQPFVKYYRYNDQPIDTRLNSATVRPLVIPSRY